MKNFTGYVHYQDAKLNLLQFLGEPIKIDPSKAVLVAAHDVWAKDAFDACEKIWAKQNALDVPVGHQSRATYEEAGHTSMSVGDYIVIEGKGLFFCAALGFVKMTIEESVAALKAAGAIA